MKKIPAFLIILLVFTSGQAFGYSRPHFSLGFKGGYFFPDIDNWSDHYGQDGAWTGGLEFGWEPLRQLELSVGAGFMRSEGHALTVSGRPSSDSLRFEQVPVNVSLIYRMVFSEKQIIVPYAGGGFSYTLWREKFNDQKTSGDRTGYHLRGGLQLLLDPVEPDASVGLRNDYGIKHTYLFFEGIYSRLDDFGKESIDLGGWSVYTGFLFEF